MPPKPGKAPYRMTLAARLQRQAAGKAWYARYGHEGAVMVGKMGGRPRRERLPEDWRPP